MMNEKAMMIKKINWLLLVGSILFLVPAMARAVPLSGGGTASIDGTLSSGEWGSAGMIDFSVNVPGGSTTPATFFEMNDASNLYLALRFARNVVDPGNTLAFEFDNDNDGIAENGDDVILVNPSVGFVDDFRTNLPPCPAGSGEAVCGFRDIDAGGTTDGAGVFLNDGLFSVYEMSHPLNSGDSLHDFSLSAGDTVGFFLFLRMIGPGGRFPEDFADTDFPGFRNYDQILIVHPVPEPGTLLLLGSGLAGLGLRRRFKTGN